MYVQVGSCPKCGAPIYTHAVWHGIIPPPNIFTCYCVEAPKAYPSTSSEGTGDRSEIGIKSDTTS